MKVFDDRRAESQRIMDETAERQKKIKEMLSHILSQPQRAPHGEG